MKGALNWTWPLRALIVAAVLAAALLAPQMPVLGPPAPPVLVVDVSASLGPGPFGPPREARIAARWYAVADGVRALESRQAASGLPREASRLGAALATVATEHPGRGVWLMTDGRATDRGAMQAAQRIRDLGGRLDVSAPARPAADVALMEATARREVSGGAEVRVRVASSVAGAGVLSLLREGQSVARRDIRLVPRGEQAVVLRDATAPRRPVAYRVRWTPATGTPDDDGENDELALGLKPERPAVLVWGDLPQRVWGGPETPFLLRLMAGWEPGALEAADLVVVSNLPWGRIGEGRVGELLGFVAGGGRLLLLGGPRAWRGGGWAGSALEDELSPLRTPRSDGTDLVVIVALDKSGSTAGGALAHLVAAAKSMIDATRPDERIGILPFDARASSQASSPIWIGGEEANRHRSPRQALDRIQAGGGTDLVGGIRAAAALATRTKARERRVLLLTDGDPDHALDEAELRALRLELDLQDVAFSALVSGSPTVAGTLGRQLARRPDDVRLLGQAAEVPGALLRKLAELRGAEERRNAPSRVRWATRPPPPLAALLPTWIQALELTPGAALLAEALWADSGMALPFVARRVVGAGEVWAFAWGPAAEAAPAQAASRLTGLVADLAASADRGLAAEVDGPDVVVRAPSARGRGRIELAAAGERAWLLEEAPGRFRGPLPCDCRLGVRVTIPAAGADPATTRPVDMPAMAPIEHRGAGVDEDALLRLAEAGGGRRLGAGEEPPLGPSPHGMPLAPWLLLLAVGLFLVERAQAARCATRSRGHEETP